MVIDDIVKIYTLGLSNFGIRHKNEDKIIVYFRYWLTYFEYIYLNDKNILLKFETNNISLYQIKYSKNINKKSLIDEILFFILKTISPIIYFKIGILPGGRSNNILSSISHLSLKAELRNSKYQINDDFKSFFRKNVEKMLLSEESQILLKLLPDLVFSNTSLSNSHLLPRIYRGSPACLMSDNYLYLNILFSSKRITFYGIQHGGGYSEWKNRTSEIMEKNLSDIFYSWSFIPPLISQNRFTRIKYINSKKKYISWIGREISPWVNTDNFFDDAEDHFKIYNHIIFFKQKLNKFDFNFLPHPNNKNIDYSILFDDINKIESNKEYFINNSKLIIFDCISHTLLYHCIFSKIPFIIIISKLPVNNLSENALQFYKQLKYHHILFEMEDTFSNDFTFHVNKIINGFNYFDDLEIIKIFNTTFDNKSILDVTSKYSFLKY